MDEIEIKLGKPYTRSGDNQTPGIKLEFSALFETQTQALAFQANLIQLIRETQIDG